MTVVLEDDPVNKIALFYLFCLPVLCCLFSLKWPYDFKIFGKNEKCVVFSPAYPSAGVHR